ncbi:GDSL-type esterase/lipase family protein [Kitasatospora sp. SUK 42]|uniref:GDSL-type esterase/lipase family protein n=1 Tax=Kitasatospora sp. SUK 42 TaxID=1588882 RepID=UPI0018C9B079|nr:GDSL-type esterase/lipase family protein [Kitasatospora sp. SUK 42]MBV2153333.1 G-D-S-L family lipolytic protein [Kitasatospora sp. SUK 42]
MTIRTSDDPFDGPRICFLGDSFVQGVGDPEFRGWVGRVLQAAAPDATAFNLGVRRQTSTQVRQRCWAEVEARSRPGDDHRLVLSVGSNDAVVEDGAPRVAHRDTLANVAALLDGARERGIGALVVGPPPVVGLGAPHLERLLRLVPELAGLCASYGVPFVDVTGALAGDAAWGAEARAADGAHPGVHGYARLAGLVLDGGFGEWLRRVPWRA